MSRRQRHWTDGERLAVADEVVRLIVIDGVPPDVAVRAVAREHRVPATAVRLWCDRFDRPIEDPARLRSALRERLALKLAERAASAETVEDADRLARSARAVVATDPSPPKRDHHPVGEQRAKSWEDQKREMTRRAIEIKRDLDARRAAKEAASR